MADVETTADKKRLEIAGARKYFENFI